MKIVAILIMAAVTRCAGGGAPTAPAADIILDAAPEILLEIDTPSEGAWTAGPLVLVTGRVFGVDGGEITTGDLVASVADGFFSLWVPLEQGENVLTLVHAPSGATATRTVFLDALPPLLTLETPSRGAVLPDGGALEVLFDASDEEGLDAVRVQGTEISPAGPFATLLHPEAGMHHIIVEAVDTLGNLAREHRSVLVGPFLACEDLATAPALSLGAGADALDLAAAEIADRLAAMEFTDLLGAYNPVYASESVEANLTDVTFSGLDLGLDPGLESLDLTVSVDELSVLGTLAAGAAELDLILTLSGVSVSGTLSVTVPEPGVMDVAAADLSLETSALELTALDESGEEVIAPTEVSGAFLEFVTSFITDLVEEQSADLLAGAAGYGAGTVPLDLFGEPVLVEYQLLDAVVQPAGLRLDMAGAFTLEGEPVHPWEHGCPGVAAPLPDVPPSGGLHVWVSYPFLDRILLGLWARGWMDFTIDQAFVDDFKAEVTLVCGMLGTLLDLADLGADAEAPLEIGLSTPLPPVLSASPDVETGVGLDIGGLTLDFSCAGRAEPQARAHVALAATLGFEVAGGLLSPAVEFGDVLLDVSGIPQEDKRRVEGGIEVALEGVFAELLPSLSDALAPIELPQMMGYQITQGIAGNDPGSGWFRVHAIVTEGEE